MAGGIKPGPPLPEFRPDWRALGVIRRAGAGQDDRLLRAVADEMATEGITIAPSTLFLHDLLATPGPLSRRSPPQRAGRHNLGVQAARELGRLDIGQCAVVRRPVVVALETIEGTDETIPPGRRPGRSRRRGGQDEQARPGPPV